MIHYVVFKMNNVTNVKFKYIIKIYMKNILIMAGLLLIVFAVATHKSLDQKKVEEILNQDIDVEENFSVYGKEIREPLNLIQSNYPYFTAYNTTF